MRRDFSKKVFVKSSAMMDGLYPWNMTILFAKSVTKIVRLVLESRTIVSLAMTTGKRSLACSTKNVMKIVLKIPRWRDTEKSFVILVMTTVLLALEMLRPALHARQILSFTKVRV